MSERFEVRLLRRARVAHETLSICVERPGGFHFQAGQYVDLRVPGAHDDLGPIRSLSIASPPGAEHLEFLMRIRDTTFKQVLADGPLADPLQVEGPFDDLRFDHTDRSESVFIAGGVGIASFLSILRDAAAGGQHLNATLFYSNRRPEDAPYLGELVQLESAIAGLSHVPIMTGLENGNGWSGERIRLGIPLFERCLPTLVGPTYYLVGGPALISGMRSALLNAHVPEEDIHLEMYTGY